MKITFLIPPVLDGTSYVERCSGCNYGLFFFPLLPVLNIATLLKDEGQEVSILDFPAQGKGINDFQDFIKKDDSDIYCFYTVFLCQETDRRARNMIRNTRKDVRFIFCGPQPTYAPESFLDKNDTFVIRAEPEFSTRDLIVALESKRGLGDVKGLSYLDGTKIMHNPAEPFIPDIDQIPIPDRTLLDHRPYCNPKLRKVPHTAIITSRGCFGRCWFCVPNSLDYARELEYKKIFGRKPPARLHSPQRVIREFTEIARLGFKSVTVIDEEFLWDEKRTLEICAGIEGLNLEWGCLARADKITEKIGKALGDSGCRFIDLGMESADDEVLKAIRKDITFKDTERAVAILKKNKIEVELNVLIGATPKETEETIKKTLKAVKRLRPDYVLFSIANPFPGTDFYYAAKREGWMYYGEYVPTDPSKDAIISYPHLSKQRLEKIIAYAHLTFYFHPHYLFRQILRIRSLSDFKNKIKTTLNFINRNFLRR
ncbi:MAG: B12-binding domain-containing radical SAM protein [Candidatus Omnitrophica bacterium]|nr:B12-binding domain-containing radical SAM protein [Candidatus Omnitrophota bacterium]